MNLDRPTYENMAFILKELANKLDVANRFIMEPDGYSLDKYNELKSMYDLIISRPKMSPAEIEAFIDELRAVRKS